MKLQREDEEFLRSLLEGVRRAIEKRAGGVIDFEWDLGARLAEILGAQAHLGIAQKFGLDRTLDHDARIEVGVGGAPHAAYEAGFLRLELWVGIKESIHSVIDAPQVREEVMARTQVGDDALPALRYPDEDPEPHGEAEG